MSEAADAERDVEDFIAEQIFGTPPEAPEQEPVFPVESIPEPKSVSEALQLADEAGQEEGTPEEEVAGTPLIERDLDGVGEDGHTVVLDGEHEEEPYVAWARKQYGEELDLDNQDVQKLAKAAFEKEKLLGKKSEETAALQRQQKERMLQEQIDALNTPGNLTPEEDSWVDEALVSGDPRLWAVSALKEGRPDLFSSILDRWSQLGEQESRQARILHSQAMEVLRNQPSEQESYTAALGQTFVSLGLDINVHGPQILQKADELGGNHPDVQGMLSEDPNVRAMATRHLMDLIHSGRTTVARVKTENHIDQRVQEETLRRQAAGVVKGGPRVESPKKSSFWEGFDEELAERGWDGNRPVYGRD